MNSVVLIAVLVLVVGWNTALGLAPCKRNASNNNAYNNFVRKHVLREVFDFNSYDDWESYLSGQNLCARDRQSFVNITDRKLFRKICNGNGKRHKGNLCTSTNDVFLYDLQVNTQNCSVTNISQRKRYVTVACDKVNNVCRPVHFEKSQDYRPSSAEQTCGLRAKRLKRGKKVRLG